MRIGSGKHTYEWIDNWAKIPDTESARAGWAHHGIVVTEAGDVITYHPGDPAVLTFDRDGNLKGSWDSGFVEGHGITIVKEGSTEYLWIADNGEKSVKEDGYKWPPSKQSPGQVLKKTLDGRTAMVLRQPDLAVYREGRYSPTAVAVDEERHGGNGDVWVSDGYGMYYVHRYDKDGNYISSINGDEGAGRFSIPHGVWIDRRKPEPELYIAECRRVEEESLLRFEGRVQVYDLNGNFKRVFGAEQLGAPRRGIVIGNGLMILPELNARVATFDTDDNFGGYLADNTEAVGTDAWPNSRDESGAQTRRKDLRPGKINSPHDMAMDAEGNLYLAEFLIGGRITKLAKLS